MSTSQGKPFQEIPIDPKNYVKYGNEEASNTLFDVLRHDPNFFEAFAFGVNEIAGMNPPTPRTETAKPDELPVIEKLEDDKGLTLRVTAPPSSHGFRKDDVHVFFEKGALTIDVDQKLPSESSSDGVKKQGVKLLLTKNFGPRECCKVNKIKAKINGGVLIVFCPIKFKKEGFANKDVGVYQVKVQELS